ncbi:unnamed protein product [Rhizoctonia solani]|uniref:Copper transport protein n=1 Tax=Rhizoctonia solani TaxID=456999 RepID=A0A8H3BKZ6_9AGAM|nr:unnamed protein product [Rhizoctonia solani]
MNSRLFSALTLLYLAAIALAHGGEEEHASAGEENIESDMMTMAPYFHWMANADALYFKSWVPRTPGGLFGSCIGLFCLALFERLLDGARGLVEAWWRRQQASTAARALVIPDNASVGSSSKSIESGKDYPRNANPVPLIAPFEPVRDLVRGAMQAVQSLVGFLLMLSVM